MTNADRIRNMSNEKLNTLIRIIGDCDSLCAYIKKVL